MVTDAPEPFNLIGELKMNPRMPEAPNNTLSEGYPVTKMNFEAAVRRRLDMQTLEWLYWIPLRVTVPASQGSDITVDIKSDAHFQCQYLTGSFTTLGAGGADVGVNQVTARISDGANDLRLMDSAVPLDLFCSPGRVLSPGVAGNPSNSLFYPFPFFHTFAANGSILVEFQNSGATDNLVNLLFVGKKLRAKR